MLSAPSLGQANTRSIQPKIEIRKLAELSTLGRRARTHSKKQISSIAESLRQFGWMNPLLVDEGGHLLNGHARIAAAELIGLTQAPVIVASHLTEAEKRAYILADNRLAEEAGWDKAVLAAEFKDLLELDCGFELAVTGFCDLEIEAIVFGPQALEDDREHCEPLARAEAVSRVGDLWRLGRHKILCGDATSPDSYVRLLGDERARVIFTDPPYNVPVKGHVTRGDHREFPMASGEMTSEEFTEFLTKALSAMRSATVQGAVEFVAIDWRHLKHLLAAGDACDLELLNIVTWAKDQAGMGSFYRSQSEFFCVFRTPGESHVNNVQLGRHGRDRSNVWAYAGFNGFRKGGRDALADHPTPKPVELVKDALLDCTRKGDLVLDPFSGGGSTLIAAERIGRVARVMELDPLYVDSALHRWEAITGEVAVHAQTGRTWRETQADRLGLVKAHPPARVRARSAAAA